MSKTMLQVYIYDVFTLVIESILYSLLLLQSIVLLPASHDAMFILQMRTNFLLNLLRKILLKSNDKHSFDNLECQITSLNEEKVI